jgi:AraC-like DNA-binding protein
VNPDALAAFLQEMELNTLGRRVAGAHLAAKALGSSWDDRHNGIYGFNGALVGSAMGTFADLAPPGAALLWTLAALGGGALSSVLVHGPGRRLHAATGLPPRRWLLERRMHALAADLMDGDRTLAELAQRYGYGDLRLLGRQFVTGRTIDEALAKSPKLTEAQMAEVKKQRAEGEALHKAGKHQESVDTLAKATTQNFRSLFQIH